MAQKADKATAVWVIRRLYKAGFRALLAGGCVRDMLLGARPDDYDVATDATPPQVKKIFRRSLMVGAKFGVVVVLHHDRRGVNRAIEVATFRGDAAYTDGRHPDAVRFSCPEEDARRRDFTINGMFFDPVSEEVIDYVGGQADLKSGIVRTIGDPNERFAEDYLRLLRAVRFSTRLGFRLHPATANALTAHAAKITKISGERVHDELTKMFSHSASEEALEAMKKYHLLPHILPELFEPNDETYLTAHQRMHRLPCADDSLLNFGALLMDLPEPVIGSIARRWGASNSFKETLQWFHRNRDVWQEAADMPLCDFKRLMGGESWQWLRVLWKVREKIHANTQQQAVRIARRAGGIAPEQIAPAPFVTGDDLIRMGYKPGRNLGRVLRELHDAQLNETHLQRADAIAEARKRLGPSDET
ncbi:MAG: CCA tRNA nucleotidyltransferase [Phycisphaerae bacterium]|nr:CCA tRNA nucleotidyltransferase [Phycisphaerae bacterium]